MITLILINYPLEQFDSKSTSLEFGLYDAFKRVFWSIALSYIIFACVHGYGGAVNWFLSHQFWLPIARLSFSIYLVHAGVIEVYMYSMETPPLITNVTIVSSGFKLKKKDC